MNEAATPDDETSPEEETPSTRRPRRTTPRRTGAMTRKTPAATPRPKPAKADEPEEVDVDLDSPEATEEETTTTQRPSRRRRRPAAKKSEVETTDVAEEEATDEEKPATRRRRRPAAKKSEAETTDVAEEEATDEEKPATRRRRRPAAKKAEPTEEVAEESSTDDAPTDERDDDTPKAPRRRRRRRPSAKKSVVDETGANDETSDEEPPAKPTPARTPRTPVRVTRRPADDDDAPDAPDEKPAPRRGGRDEPRRPVASEPKARAMGGGDRSRGGQERSASRGLRQTGARELKPFVEKGFELVHLPDGTLVRSEMAKKNRRGDGGRRRPQYGDEGPGPALPGFDEVSYEPDAPPRSARALRNQGIILGDLPVRCRRSVNFLKRRLPLIPRVAVILGSGLSGVADLSNSDDVIDFADVPDFPTPSAPGHDGIIRVGAVEGTPTLFCEGRVHYYENGSMADTVYPVQTLLALGVERFILTTSAGALNPSYRVGDLMFINDQINLTGDNPFFATGGHEGPAFVDTTRIYDQETIRMRDRLCRRARVTGREGVLAVTRGPVYETPAERKMLAGFGADAVSMSVGHEAMALAHAQATVVGLAVVVNEATAATKRPVSHDEVLAAGKRGAMGLARLVTAIIGQGW